MTAADTTKSLLSKLTGRSPGEGENPHRIGIDWIVFGSAGVIAIAFVVWGIVSPAGLGEVADGALSWTIDTLGWLFVIAATVFTVFVIVVAAGRFGRIPLGRDDEGPQYRTTSWISMMFATGMGIGLVFYGVAEPLFFYISPPPGTVESEVPAGVGVAMGQTLFHWTLYPWAMYAIVGLGVAYGTYRLGRSQLFSSMFTSLFGPKIVNGAGGRVINVLAILATLFGSACSLGLGALQIGGGIESSGFMSVTTPVLVVIIAVLTAAFVASAVTGIERGIQWLSNINMVLAVILAIIVFLGGPTLFILNVLPDAIGAFVGNLPTMASRTAAAGDASMAEWMSSWTVFYWAWWISWTPFVGLFIARISRGRTVRQFVVGVLFVPSIVSTLWFTIFGGGAIGIQQRAAASAETTSALTSIEDGEKTLNFDTVLFSLLGSLSFPQWIVLALTVLTAVLIAIFFVTGADSASIVMGALSENGVEEPKRGLVVFWGVSTGAVAAVMLLAGGDDPAAALNGLKNITIVSAVPFVIIMLLLCVALWKDLSKDPLVIRRDLAQHLLHESVASGVDVHHGEPFQLSTVELSTEEIRTIDAENAARAKEAAERDREAAAERAAHAAAQADAAADRADTDIDAGAEPADERGRPTAGG